MAADSSALSLRSVLKMLNSVSSAVNAACVSSPASGSAVSASPASELPSPMRSPLITLANWSRSSVKSCSTFKLLENDRMETTSAGLICVARNF